MGNKREISSLDKSSMPKAAGMDKANVYLITFLRLKESLSVSFLAFNSLSIGNKTMVNP